LLRRRLSRKGGLAFEDGSTWMSRKSVEGMVTQDDSSIRYTKGGADEW
jgi:hypothetical protein